MSVPSDTEGHPTQRLVEAGEILRTLSPPTFASLHLVIDYEVSTQAEMADIIGCVRPSVSKYLQSLENLPVALVQKQGHDYSVTSAGERVFGLIDSMLHRLGIDLRSIDWGDDEEQDGVAEILTPLYDSRSTLPFLVLESIRDLSGLDDVLGTPQPVKVADVVDDVSLRRQDIGKNVGPKQIRQTLQRFENKKEISFDGSQIRFLQKGQEHALLMHEIVVFLNERTNDVEQIDSKRESESNSSLKHPPSTTGATQTELIDTPDSLANQFRSDDDPTIVAAYCLLESDSDSQPRPVLPLRSLTAKELTKQVSHLIEKYGEDASLEPYWTVQTESGLYPVYPADAQQEAGLSYQNR